MIESRYTARAMRAFPALLDRPARGNSRVIGIPVFMDVKNLQVFIDEDLRYGSKKWNTETNVDLCELIQFQTAKEKPARGGLGVIFQLQLEG